MTTLEKNLVKNWEKVIRDYELVKKGAHRYFNTCKDLYEFYQTSAKEVAKHHQRWLDSGRNPESLLPLRRGRRLGDGRKLTKDQERHIVQVYRKLQTNRYELVLLFKPYYLDKTPSPATMYRILKRYPLNKKAKEKILRYEKSYPGELGHMDSYYLPKTILKPLGLARGYLMAFEDDCTRITYAEIVESLRAESAASFMLRALSWFKRVYGFEFERILSDNGSEFVGSNFKFATNLVGIKHIKTRPYRPQTNGKVEAFWKIIKREFLDPEYISSRNEFIKKLGIYLYWYNNERRHGGLDYQTPFDKLISVTDLVN